MSETLTITLSPQAAAVLGRVEQLPRNTLLAIKQGVDEQNQYTVAHIQRQYLSYPKGSPSVPQGLRVITNRLRGSIRPTPATISGDTVTASIGSNVKYAAIHEFGGVISHPARAGHVRLRTDRNGVLLRRADGRLAIFARKTHKRAKQVNYQGKAYSVTYPARAYIRNGIADTLPDYSRRISANIVKLI